MLFVLDIVTMLLHRHASKPIQVDELMRTLFLLVSVPLTLLFFSSANKQIGRGSGIVNTWYMTDGMRHLFGTEYRNLVLTKVGLLLTC